MTDEKITHNELHEVFGDTIPVVAVNFVFNSGPSDMTIAVARERLRGMGELWKALKKTLIRPDNIHPFTYGGRVVGIEHEPLCIVETNEFAEQMAMLLNLGHERFLREPKS